jgi:hypothetical protein
MEHRSSPLDRYIPDLILFNLHCKIRYFQSQLFGQYIFQKLKIRPVLSFILFLYDTNNYLLLIFCPLSTLLWFLQTSSSSSQVCWQLFSPGCPHLRLPLSLLQAMPLAQQVSHPTFCFCAALHQHSHLIQGPLVCPFPVIKHSLAS